jgi:hypothetical protein
MESNKSSSKGNGLIDPQKVVAPEKKQPKKVSTSQDGLMERQENKVLTDDGRELLKEGN